MLRRHPDAKRKLRAFYYRLNGKPVDDEIPESVRDELAERYREPNARLAAQLVERGSNSRAGCPASAVRPTASA